MNYKLTIDRFEEKKVVLKTEDGNTIVWPKNKLPNDAKEGTILNFIITTNDIDTENKKELAKNILNEILEVSD